ncbi:MAG: ABC transporter permease [Planctomycetaceae bacterium]|nr:ABC transporter permease [Planctomycetaceae bacterium]
MLTGPIFRREALTAPRSFRHFAIRSGSVLALFVLMYTADKAVLGFGAAGSLGASARFGALLFQIFSLVELTLSIFFGLLFAAGTVSQEKDRGTLILLLMTDLKNTELVVGKLASGLLAVAVVLVTSIPAFFLLPLLGGVTAGQIGQALAICAAAAVAAGSWGTLVAYWREKTFQTLAIGVIGIVAFLAIVEAIVALLGGGNAGQAVGLLNPYRAIVPVLNPFSEVGGWIAAGAVPALLGLAVVINAVTLWRLRIWNPPRHVHEIAKAIERETTVERTASKSRDVWDAPILWREIRTRAYGRKTAVIKAAYIALAAAAVWFLMRGDAGDTILGSMTPGGMAFVGLAFVSLMLVNAQSVTSLTGERDARTLELLLVTDIDAKEFVTGKLAGALYNAKELILVPLSLAAYLAFRGEITAENAFYTGVGFLVLVAFAAMLGLHSAVTFHVSRTAIANSLGTLFFLFVGIALFLLLLVEAQSSFSLQLQSFLVFIVAGSIVLGASLTQKNPAPALWLSAALLPFLTFFAIASFLLGDPLAVTLAIVAAYGFTTVAMLVPAVSDFDVALGRSRGEKG